jgi:hypothetical protein
MLITVDVTIRRREMWKHYSTHDTWMALLDATKQRSQDYATLAEIYGTVMVGRLGDLLEDLQRVHKKVCYGSCWLLCFVCNVICELRK